MGLESATYVDDLNSAWPLGSDARTQGDDHLRLIKSALLASRGTQALAEAGTDTVSRLWTALEIKQAIEALESTPDLSGYAVVSTYTTTASSAYLSGNSALTQNVWTKVALNAERWDNGNDFNTTTNLYTLPSTGVYLFIAGCRIGTLASGSPAQAAVYLNGALYHQLGEGNAANAAEEQYVGAGIVSAAAGATLGLYAYVETTGDSALGGASNTFLQVCRLVL